MLALSCARPRPGLMLLLLSCSPSWWRGTMAASVWLSLAVNTTAGGRPTSAGVGLMGVDSTLSQLAPLLGPDDWGRVTVSATSDRPAFDLFDPRALTLGQVRGEHAARAAVLRISQLPVDQPSPVRPSASGSVAPDLTVDLVTGFYPAYEVLVERVRAWEDSAPEDETMQPVTMASLWSEALDARRRVGEPATDGWGRELTLEVLPADLLAQLDPRQVVADGTRLPEDIVSWTAWVNKEVRR